MHDDDILNSFDDIPFPTDENFPPDENNFLDIPFIEQGQSDQNTAPFSKPDWFEGLNPQQLEAVENVDGPCLVLAGAGTGKTKILTTRLAHVIHLRKASPYQILCVTFTNKAAKEMKDRIEHLTGIRTGGMWLGTFHSLCLRILRRDANMVGLTSTFTVLDDDDQIRLLKQVLAELNVDDKRYPAKQMIMYIQAWKDKAMMPSAVTKADVGSLAGGKLDKVYNRYQERLKTLNAVDFGDLIMLCVELFKKDKEILKYYRDIFKYILVDEYQDTNIAQYQWLRLLSMGTASPNICCVGDDDQSIYGWRGAEVGNILNFEKDYNDARMIRLEQNYRSTGHILKCANGVIAHNTNRLGKNLFTAVGDGNKVKISNMWDGEKESRIIAHTIEQAESKGQKLSEMAILVRAGWQTREFEEKFLSMGIAYRVIGGAKFYEREEIRDAIAYLRLIHQTSDDLAMERVINKPTRGIGKATIQLLQIDARKRGIPLYQSAVEILQTDELTARAKNALKSAIDMFDRWRTMAQTESHVVVLETVLDESGYTNFWKKSKDPKAPGKLENLKELVSALEEYENIAGFLEHVALVMAIDNASDGEMVSLMTLHASKGLEFERIFLPGWEDGLFPSEKSLEEKGHVALEEERRLAYVGITRARKDCHISFVNNRRIHGQWTGQIPSRFIGEVPAENVEVVGQNGYNSPRQETGWNTVSTEVEMMDSNSASSGFSRNDRCFHQKFGMGIVRSVDGDYLTIDFDHAGRKKVMATFIEKS